MCCYIHHTETHDRQCLPCHMSILDNVPNSPRGMTMPHCVLLPLQCQPRSLAEKCLWLGVMFSAIAFIMGVVELLKDTLAVRLLGASSLPLLSFGVMLSYSGFVKMQKWLEKGRSDIQVGPRYFFWKYVCSC